MREWGRLGLFKGNMKEKKLLLKILSYFLSMLIPIVIVGAFGYWYSSNLMKDQFNERIHTNIQNSSNVVDNYLKAAQETGVNFLNDFTVRRLLMPRDEQTKYEMSELWRIRNILQRSENIIDNFTDEIFVYIDDQDVYVSAGVNELEFYFDEIYRYELYDAAYWRERRESAYPSLEVLPASYVSKNHYSAPVKVVPIVISEKVGNHHASIVINISMEAIEREIQGSAVFASTQYLILDSANHVLSDPMGIFSSVHDSQQALINEIHDGSPAVVSIHGQLHMATYHQSNLFGWKYYSFTPLSAYHLHTNGILTMTILLCFVLLIMGIIFSLIFSLRIYNPIRNIRDILAQKNDVLDFHEPKGSSDMFALIRQSIDQLSMSHELYKEKHNKFSSKYVEYSLVFLLKGHTINEEEILRETLQTEFGFHKAGFVCCTVLLNFEDVFFEDIQDAERMHLINGIKKIIWAVLERKAPTYVLDYRRNVFVCLVNLDHASEISHITDAFHQMIGIFEYDICKYYEITIGIGQYYEQVNDIGTSYNEAMTAVNMRNKESRFQIIHSHDLNIGESYVYSLSDEQTIMNYLKLRDKDGLQYAVNEIIGKNLERNISYEKLQQFINEMYITGNRFLAEKGLNVNEVMNEKQAKMIPPHDGQFYHDVRELAENMIQYYTEIINATSDMTKSRTNNLASMIEEYIHKNYMRDLGLEQIADEMGVSVKYVSRIFKEKVGINLSEYITRLRIEKAKDLLRNSDLKMNDIGEQVGIFSRSTFHRVFKKIEGISPNEYRKLHMEEQGQTAT